MLQAISEKQGLLRNKEKPNVIQDEVPLDVSEAGRRRFEDYLRDISVRGGDDHEWTQRLHMKSMVSRDKCCTVN